MSRLFPQVTHLLAGQSSLRSVMFRLGTADFGTFCRFKVRLVMHALRNICWFVFLEEIFVIFIVIEMSIAKVLGVV